MPVYAELHDGRRLEFPDGTDPAVVQATVRKVLGTPEAPQDKSVPLDPLSSTLAGAVRGAGSIGATLLAPMDALNEWLLNRRAPTMSELVTGKQNVQIDRRGQMDAAFKDLGADPASIQFQGGKLGAEIAGTMGTGNVVGGLAGAVPAIAQRAPSLVNALRTGGMTTGANPATMGARAADMATRVVGGAATGGAAAGLVNPDDAGVGALVGGALPVVTKAAGLAGQAVGSALRPDQAKTALARTAMDKYGIPLSVSDVSGSQIVKGTRSALDDVPVIGRIGAKQAGNVQGAFNRAVGQVFGESADSLSPAVMDAAKTRIGGNLSQVWNNNSLKLDGQYVAALQNIDAQAAAKLNPEQAGQVSRTIQNLLAKVDPNGEVPGTFANNWQSELRMVSESEKGLHKKLLADLRAETLAAFRRSVPAQDAAVLDKALKEYKAFKTVQPLMDRAALGVAGRSAGDVPAALLPEAVRKSYGGSAGPFGDLPQIGSQFVADRVARTGGSARAMVQNSALGTGLALGTWNNPLIPLLGIPAAAATEGLLASPALGRAIVGGAPASPVAGLLAPYAYQIAPVLAADR